MNAEQVETMLRQFLHREPFQPFMVELVDGRLIEIHRPKVAVGGGGASFLTSTYELVEFNCEEIRSMRSLTVPGNAS